MKIERLSQPGVILFTPDVYKDDRGYFTETFNGHYGFEAKQGNQSFSKKGTIRGLHYQYPAVCKLIWVSSGRILDVALNLKTGEHITVELSADTHQRLLVPAGYAHGFQALEDCVAHYLMDDVYNANNDNGLTPLKIAWPVSPFIISDKDRNAPAYEDIFGDN